MQVVAEFKLYISNIGDAAGNFLAHGTCYLEEHVNCLRVKLKGTVQLILFVSLVGLSYARAHVRVLVLDLFDICVELADVFGLEGQVFVVSKNLLLGQNILGHSLLFSFILLALRDFLLQLVVKESDDGFDFIAE